MVGGNPRGIHRLPFPQQMQASTTVAEHFRMMKPTDR